MRAGWGGGAAQAAGHVAQEAQALVSTGGRTGRGVFPLGTVQAQQLRGQEGLGVELA